MRKTFGVYVLGLSILAASSAPIYAAPKNGASGDSFFVRVKNAIVRLLDDAKIVVPVG
jgi:hypothetical protein